jgi:sugar/nucleoside kinase (ribokinase family)
MKTFDIVTVGHFAVDHIQSRRLGTTKKMLGGSPAYVSMAARKLDACVGVVSKVGDDFPQEYIKLLSSKKVDLFGVKKTKNGSTTSFVLRYMNGNRQLLLKSHAPPILTEDVSLAFKAKAIHVAPIAGEISCEVIEELCKRTDTLSLDPQGFLRTFDAKGRVNLKKWADRRILEQVDVFKSSLHEIRKIASSKSLEVSMKKIQDFGVKIVIVTLGSKGAALLFDKTLYRIPVIQPKEQIDLTGAGDVFAGAFLAEFINKRELVWCACAGSAMASLKVESVGPLFLGEKEAIYERAKRLYKKCMSVGTHNGL